MVGDRYPRLFMISALQVFSKFLVVEGILRRILWNLQPTNDRRGFRATSTTVRTEVARTARSRHLQRMGTRRHTSCKSASKPTEGWRCYIYEQQP
jgi:hypothetical protein